MKLFYKSIFQLSFLFLFLPIVTLSQVPNKSDIPLPIVFKKYWHKKDLDKVIQMTEEALKRSDSKRLWYVISKEDNMPAYKSIGNRTVISKIPFGQSLIVIGKQNDFIEVVDADAAIGGMKLNPNSKYYGWIPISKVIPSAYAPKDSENNQLSQKAMCILNIDGEIMKTSDIKTEYTVYKNSTGNNKSKLVAQANYIYYVYDRIGTSKNGRSLLTLNSRLTIKNNYTLKTEILGWVDNNFVQLFNTRICYEPNWTPMSQSDYQNTNIGAFKSYNYAERFKQSCNARTEAMVTVPRKLNSERMDRSIQRLIQMEPPVNNIVKVGAIGKLQGNSNSDVSQITKQRFQDDMRKFGKLNVLFVMDATSSMKNYRSSVAGAIIESMNQIKGELDGGVVNQLKFGVSVYRDYADGGQVYESIPLTSNHTQVSNWVNNISCMSKDNDMPEAVFQGLEKALNTLNRDEKNLVIWIGDCGNHKNDSKTITESEIGKIAAEKNVSWVSFQVKLGNDPSYRDFQIQVLKITRNTAQEFLKKTRLNNEYSENFIRVGLQHSPNETKLDLMQEYPKNRSQPEDATMYAKTRTAKRGASMNPVQLKSEIVNAVSSMYQQHKDNMVLLKNLNGLMNNVKDVNGLNPDLLATFRSLGYTDQDIKNLAQKEFRLESYIALECDNKYERAYREVVFISEDELLDLREFIKTVISANNVTDSRNNLYNALLQQMIKFFGEGEDDKKALKAAQNIIKQMTLNEIWRKLFGIDFKYNGGDNRLVEIKSTTKFDDNWVNTFKNKLEKSLDNLSSIDRSYPIQKQVNNQTFYYIEREFFPGAR